MQQSALRRGASGLADTTAPSSGDGGITDRDRKMHRVAIAFVIGAGTAALLSTVLSGAAPGAAAFTMVGLASLTALALGPSLNASRRTTPWRLLLGGAIAFSATVVGRAGRPSNGGVLPPAEAVTAILGYALILACLGSFLRDHRDRDRGSLTDSWLVAAGAVPPIVVLLVAPAVERAGASFSDVLVVGIFPLVDIVFLQLVTRLAFAMPTCPPAMRYLLTSAALLFSGDMVWAMLAAGLLDVPAAAIDTFYLFSFVAIGAAALHPSMRLLTVPTAGRTGPLRSARLFMVTIALLSPALLVATVSLDSTADRLAVATGIAVAGVVAVQRARRAVTEHARNEVRLAHLATHDTLTGLPNRRMVLEHLEQLLQQRANEPVAVLFVDVDRFKLINDTWGHQVGDELLTGVARRLQAALPEADMLAHMSGDEFLVVASCADEDACAALAEHVLETMRRPFGLSVGEVVVTASVGVAVARGEHAAGTRDDVVRDGDIALYQAKAAGRNRLQFFDVSMRRAVLRRYSLERDLRVAVAEGQFAVHYQPIVDIASNDILGFEALLRWNRPGHGLVEPHRFMPVLEDTDLIIEVGRFVLDQALLQLTRWHAAGFDLYMSVNVAARQIHHGRLVNTVGGLLDRYGVPPDSLLLELTESLLIEESPVVRESIDGLTLLGVRLAIDDFGTGHSSLQYLTRFPVSAVKVDRSFVDGLGRDSDNTTIVQAVVGMSHALGLSVIAEGVETMEQRDHLQRLGCDAVQGYVDGRPGAAAQFPTRAPFRTAAPYQALEKGSQA